MRFRWPTRSRACFGIAVLTTLSFGALPMSLHGQTPAGGSPSEWSDDGMETLARAYLALSEVRDELHRELAETHQAGERQEVRRRADERMAEVLMEKGISAEDYERLTFLVSADDDAREAFEAILLRLRGESGG
jgi:hypothetical protein